MANKATKLATTTVTAPANTGQPYTFTGQPATPAAAPANASSNGNGNNALLPVGGKPFTNKYAGVTAKLGGSHVVPQFKLHAMALHCNAAQYAPMHNTSIMGKLHMLVAAMPGITGVNLCMLAMAIAGHGQPVAAVVAALGQTSNSKLAAAIVHVAAWQGHPSAYTQNGAAGGKYWADYIIGLCNNQLRHCVATPAKA